METVIAAIQKTPIPTILILAGLLFLLLGFVTKLGGLIEVSTEQKRLTIPIGLLVLTVGLLLTFIPASNVNVAIQDSKPSPTPGSSSDTTVSPIPHPTLSKTTPIPPTPMSAEQERNAEIRHQQERERLKAEKELQRLKREAQELERAKKQDEADALKAKLAQEKAAMHRARWPSYNFPPPNGGLLVFTIMPDGNPACASYDGASCLWGHSYDQIDFGRLSTLVCGEGHRAKWGVTGYEDPKHWCNLARNLRDNPR